MSPSATPEPSATASATATATLLPVTPSATPTASLTPTSGPTLTPLAEGAVPADALYVSPAGRDNDSCALASPCASFDYALGRLRAGGTLVLLDGVYSQPLIIRVSGSAGAPITVMGQPGARPVIDGGNAGSRNPVDVRGDWVIVQGLEVRNSAQHGVEVTGNDVTLSELHVHDIHSHGVLVAADGVRVENSLIERAVLENINGQSTSGFSSGLKCQVGCVNVVFSGNTVRDNYGENIAITRGINVQVIGNQVGNSYAPGIYVDNSINVAVLGNFVRCTADFGGSGLQSAIQLGEEYYDGWGAQLQGVIISGNRVENCRNGFVFWGSDVGDSILRDITVENNTFVLTTHAGIALEGEAQNVTVSGNTIIQANENYYYGPEGVVYISNIERSIP